MYRSREGAGHHPGQARYANAIYTYRPDFRSGDYREGVTDESDAHVTFEFQTPYIIAASPASDAPWGIYESGCRQGLIIAGRGGCKVSLSTDRGRTWTPVGMLDGRLDATDQAKGRRQYWLRFESQAKALIASGLVMTTVCQCNSSIIPQLADGGSEVWFLASGRGLVSAATLPQANTHIVSGGFDSPQVTLELATPRGERPTAVYAAAHVRSSNPPSPEIEYKIDYSTDRGKSFQPLVKDWRITRRGVEPEDFWSQSFSWGEKELDSQETPPIQVRFSNSGGKQYARAEMHRAYRLPKQDATSVTFHWTDDRGPHTATHEFAPGDGAAEQVWSIPTGKNVETNWVEVQSGKVER
jgi:hypothetical protein